MNIPATAFLSRPHGVNEDWKHGQLFAPERRDDARVARAGKMGRFLGFLMGRIALRERKTPFESTSYAPAQSATDIEFFANAFTLFSRKGEFARLVVSDVYVAVGILRIWSRTFRKRGLFGYIRCCAS